MARTQSKQRGTEAPEDARIRVEYEPLAELERWPQNPKEHATEVLRASFKRFGFTIPMLVDEGTGRLVAGHGRLDELSASKLAGKDPPARIVRRADGEWLVPVLRGVRFANAAEAEAYLVADNRITELGGWREDALLELLQRASNTPEQLAGVGYSESDVAALAKRVAPNEEERGPSMAERFLVPPFSVLDARQGYWKERKAEWLSLGIASEVGRGENLLKMSDTILGAGNPKALGAYKAGGGRAVRRGTAQAFGGGPLPEGNGSDLTASVRGDGGSWTGTSIFDPVLCELVYRWFSAPDAVVLDPFAGGSVRGVVAGWLGRAYHGVDLREEQIVANMAQWAAIETRGKAAASQAPPLETDAASSSDPAWALGYDVEDLRAVAALFAATDKPFALGAFSRVKENTVAEWAAAGELSVAARHGSPIAVASLARLKRDKPVKDFADKEIARALAGDIYVRRMAGNREALTALLSAPGQRLFVEVWQESEEQRAVAEALGLVWLGTKVKASSELIGVWGPPGAAGVGPTSADLCTLERLALPRLPTAELLGAIKRGKPQFADHYSAYNVGKSWSALALRGYGGLAEFIEKPAEMSKAWKAANGEKLSWEIRDTELRAAFPEAEPIVAAVPGVKHRIRLMRLAPGGGELLRHADITDPDAGTMPGQLLRIHVPLATNEGVRFQMWRLDGSQVSAHMGVGEAWYLDTRKPHTAANLGKTERIHLVMDVESCDELLALLPTQTAPTSSAAPATMRGELPPVEPWEPRRAGPAASPAPPRRALPNGAIAPRWMPGNSEHLADRVGQSEADRPVLLEGLECDLVFSCPPYADLEVYSDDPADISNMPWPAFLAAYRRIIWAACERLRPNRFAAWVIGDVRDPKGNYRGLIAETIAAFAAAGLQLYNEAILVTAVGSLPLRVGRFFSGARKLGKTHQNLLVFVKGDAKLAAEACGPIEIGGLEALAEIGDGGVPDECVSEA